MKILSASWRTARTSELKGREANLLASYMIEHPVLSFAEMNSDKIAKGVKNAADFVNDIQTIGNALDKLFDSGHS